MIFLFTFGAGVAGLVAAAALLYLAAMESGGPVGYVLVPLAFAVALWLLVHGVHRWNRETERQVRAARQDACEEVAMACALHLHHAERVGEVWER